MSFSREQIRAAKRLKLPLIEIRIDDRYSKQDGVGEWIAYAGVATQEFANRARELQLAWPILTIEEVTECGGNGTISS
jgi:MoxR-like ATPase